MNAAAARHKGRSAALRIGALALSAGATMAGASGCSSHAVNVPSDPVAAVLDAAATSTKIHSAEVATTVDMAVDGSDLKFTGAGEFDFDQQIGAITLKTPQSKAALDEVVTPTTLYLRQNGTNTAWKRVDASKLPDGDLISAGYTSPVFDFALLRGAADGAVHYVGQDTVRGTTVTHYTGTLDLTQAAHEAQNPIKGDLLAASRSFSSKTVPFDVYLDTDSRVRRVVAHFSFPATAPEHGLVQIAATTDLFDLDQPVTVQVPSAKDLAAATPSAAVTPSASAKHSAAH